MVFVMFQFIGTNLFRIGGFISKAASAVLERILNETEEVTENEILVCHVDISFGGSGTNLKMML